MTDTPAQPKAKKPSDPRLARLLAEMLALSAILPAAVVLPAASAIEQPAQPADDGAPTT